MPDGRLMRVELALWFGDSAVMLADEFPEMGVLSPLNVGGTATVLHFTADDAGAVWERALSGGAEVRQPLQEAFWGELYGQVAGPLRPPLGSRRTPPRRASRRLERAVAAAFSGSRHAPETGLP